MGDSKQEQLLQAIRLGADLTTAALLAGYDFDDIEDLEEDEILQRKIKVTEAELQFKHLKRIDTASAIAAEKGTASPSQWMLEKLNPERFGKALKLSGDEKKPIPARIILQAGPTNGKNEETST